MRLADAAAAIERHRLTLMVDGNLEAIANRRMVSVDADGTVVVTFPPITRAGFATYRSGLHGASEDCTDVIPGDVVKVFRQFPT